MSLHSTLNSFGYIDFIVFFAMMIGSLGIGVYHCFRSNKTTEDFLLASRSMSPVPVALSLMATFISSISILGFVGEVYGHGIQLIWSLVGLVIGKMIAIYVFMPVIYPLQLSSINEYLELRFRSPVLKNCVLVISTISWMMFLGICLYAPTLALEAVTPLKSSTYILVLGTVVTLYSSFGGLKAVVWSDAFQSVLILLGVLIATVTSIVSVGGLGEVWKIASKHDRTDALDFGLGLHTRHTVFNTLLMYIFKFVFVYSCTQSTLQRVSTMPDYRRAKLILHMNCFGLLAFILLLYLTGLSIFAVYADCDPISMGYIKRKDQIFPYYVMEHLGYIRGVPGAFVACLFSGTMSTISSSLNALPSMLWTDFVSHFPFFVTASEQIKTLANKLMTFCLGLIMIGLAFMASQMSGLIQATMVITSILDGPLLGVFLMGYCIPICGKKGAFAGLTASIVFMTWLAIGSQLHGMKVTMLPLSIDRCENITQLGTQEMFITTLGPELLEHDNSPVHPLSGFYGISYTYLLPFGTLACVGVGIVASLITGREKLEDLDPAYVIPVIRRFVGGQLKKKVNVELSASTHEKSDTRLAEVSLKLSPRETHTE